ncbi:2-octaprenyl-3-methyl-6-methoxy-1,4-benzoquinol hydroxylase, partial [Sodalis-like endosymbiont of Proechinophthirus fluctus]
IDARRRDEPWDRLAVLQRYQRLRRGDNLLMQAGIDAFYIAFSNDLAPLMLARNLGLMLVERANGIKQRVLRYALGM